MKKKMFVTILGVCMLLTMTACGNSAENTQTGGADQQDTAETSADEEDTAEASEDEEESFAYDPSLPTSTLIEVDVDPMLDGMAEITVPIETGINEDPVLNDPHFEGITFQEGDSFNVYYCCGVLPYSERQTEYVYKTTANLYTMEDMHFYVEDPSFTHVQIIYMEYTGSNAVILDDSEGVTFTYGDAYGDLASQEFNMYIGTENCQAHYDSTLGNHGWARGSLMTAAETFAGRYNFVPMSQQ